VCGGQGVEMGPDVKHFDVAKELPRFGGWISQHLSNVGGGFGSSREECIFYRCQNYGLRVTIYILYMTGNS
jgi:hypothetical protein